jgi:hypothetical protein
MYKSLDLAIKSKKSILFIVTIFTLIPLLNGILIAKSDRAIAQAMPTRIAQASGTPSNPISTPIQIRESTTIYNGPLPTNKPINVGPKPTAPIIVGSCKDSIFNTKNCNLLTGKLDFSIRQAAGLTDKNQLRAAVYARLMEIARTKNRKPDEQALMDWLALQVKQTRIEAARLAVVEYDAWNQNPWGYYPPVGYDFPAYTIPHPQSRIWLTTSPNPPVLANKSWQTYLADIVSNNGWSPLNNPMLTKGQKNSSLENVVGFPVFGTVLAYQKLYGTDAGARILAETTAQISGQSFNLAPVGVAIASPANVNTLRVLNLNNLAPYTARNMDFLKTELAGRLKGTSTRVPIDPKTPNINTVDIIKSKSTSQLRANISRIASGEALGNFVVTFVVSTAIQEIISESIMLDSKLKLRAKLVENLDKQKSAPLPNLGNLLYYDIQGVVALYGADYQPTDPVELERMMGPQEVYRAFLLSTIE